MKNGQFDTGDGSKSAGSASVTTKQAARFDDIEVSGTILPSRALGFYDYRAGSQ